MSKITKEQYEFALSRIEELLPLVDDSTPANDKNAVELTLLSDVVIAYEKEHYPIGKPTVAELIELSLEEKGLTQKQLANEIGVSPSRISDDVSGRSEPTLKVARMLCQVLGIQPAAIDGQRGGNRSWNPLHPRPDRWLDSDEPLRQAVPSGWTVEYSQSLQHFRAFWGVYCF